MSQKSAYFYANGRRKTAVATVRLFPDGKGDITINGIKAKTWSDDDAMLLTIFKPLELLGGKKEYDLEIITSGGGKKAQADAISLGISRAIAKKNGDFRQQLKSEGLLTRDARIKERKKPGLKKARRSPQWAKR